MVGKSGNGKKLKKFRKKSLPARNSKCAFDKNLAALKLVGFTKNRHFLRGFTSKKQKSTASNRRKTMTDYLANDNLSVANYPLRLFDLVRKLDKGKNRIKAKMHF